MSGHEELWFSRLRPTAPQMDPNQSIERVRELPHVRGRPIRAVAPNDARVVTEWPNLAGVLEPIHDGDIVRWDRSLAPEPPSGDIRPYGARTEVALLHSMFQWFRKFIRSLEQEPGILSATKFDTSRAIVLTPKGLAGSPLTPGVEPVPERLGEFPGGVVLTLREEQWDDRSTYADETLRLLTGRPTL